MSAVRIGTPGTIIDVAKSPVVEIVSSCQMLPLSDPERGRIPENSQFALLAFSHYAAMFIRCLF